MVRETLHQRLLELAYAPTAAPQAVYANACGEAEKALRAASKALKSLSKAIESEGFDVLVDVEGNYSVSRREDQ